LHGSHGYLLVISFLATTRNRRTDGWGGDTERRARLALEIGKAVRKRCGSDFVVGIKLSLDEYLGDLGTTPDETLRVLALLEQAKLFDYVCLSHTDYHQNHKLVPPQSSGETAPLAENARRIREALNGRIPLLIQGSVRNLATAADIVQRGQSDLVGLVRAHIADPEIVRKAREGRAGETRRCVGANQGCWRRLGQNVSCTVNPAAGARNRNSAYALQKPAPAAKKVLVIGGGPGGLKAADRRPRAATRSRYGNAAPPRRRWMLQAGQLPDFGALELPGRGPREPRWPAWRTVHANTRQLPMRWPLRAPTKSSWPPGPAGRPPASRCSAPTAMRSRARICRTCWIP
jgi:hypothetical protein